RKGVDTVVEGFARLFTTHGFDRGRLVIVGGESEQPDARATPEIGRLQSLSRHARIADRVTFVGRRGREELKNYYSAADVFVTVPWYEPFGITPIEAMACGTPVIGANVGGVKFTVVDGETGLLVPPRDPAALGERLAELLRQPELRRQLGQQAQLRATRLFTWKKVAGAIDVVYRDVLRTVRSDRWSRIGSGAIVDRGFAGTVQALESSRRTLRSGIVEAAEILGDSFTHGGKVLLCGNGGSAADAQHFAAELVGRFRDPERPALPAVALTADGVVLTAWANDADFEDVFARQVEALGHEGDVLVAISTSGRSKNLVAAFEAARRRGLRCVALLGRDGGELLPLADHALVVPSFDTQDIQAVHLVVIHLLCELVEEALKARRWVPAVRASRGASDSAVDPAGPSEHAEPSEPAANGRGRTSGRAILNGNGYTMNGAAGAAGGRPADRARFDRVVGRPGVDDRGMEG
ncbi:MAG: glycosyltransferase, partial [Chloroflexota bacterium]|nr:glycosyltransferase [Chloroflexota bacterium]